MYDDIVVYNPHSCIVTKLEDRNCDFRSYEYSNILSRSLKSILITSDIPRYICDNNRRECRQTISRNRVREYIKPNNFILEVHSFAKKDNYWFNGSREEPDIVLLETNNYDIVKSIYKVLKPYYDVVILKGSYINDVQREVNEKMSHGVLIELAYELTYQQVNNIGELLKVNLFKI